MKIRRAETADRETLYEIWLRSVRATHTFLSPDHIESYKPLAHEFLMSNDADFWVLYQETGTIVGFMAMAGKKIDAMFLDPPFLRRGGGRLLVNHAVALHGDLTVDVNEQNVAAIRFYEACGFVVEGRSEFDETGRPYPLLHMRLLAAHHATAAVKKHKQA